MKIKTLLVLLSFFMLPVLNGCWVAQESDYNQRSTPTTRTVYDEYNADDLNSYGQWIMTPEYGRVWRPNTSQGWQPYADGHWVYDGRDWVWSSYEPYGNIVYHYGYWEYLGGHQWVWIPANTRWSPACVDWVYYGDRVAWAPRPHPGHSFGNPWDRHDYPVWIVVNNGDFYNDHVYTHRISDVSKDKGRFRDDQIIRRQPDVKIIEQNTKTPVTVTRDIIRNGRNTGGTQIKKDPTPAPPPVVKTPVRKEEPLPPVKNPDVRTPVERKDPETGNTRTPTPAVKTPATTTPTVRDRKEATGDVPSPAVKTPVVVKQPATAKTAAEVKKDTKKGKMTTPATRAARTESAATKTRKAAPAVQKTDPAEKEKPAAEKQPEKRAEQR